MSEFKLFKLESNMATELPEIKAEIALTKAMIIFIQSIFLSYFIICFWSENLFD